MLSFLFCGVTLATIEKDTTTKNTQNKQNITPGDSSGETGLIPNNVPNQKRPSGYDNFIDKNNNGIDDRVEQKTESHKKDTGKKEQHGSGDKRKGTFEPSGQSGRSGW